MPKLTQIDVFQQRLHFQQFIWNTICNCEVEEIYEYSILSKIFCKQSPKIQKAILIIK